MTPNSLEQWFTSKAALPIWYKASVEYYGTEHHNERTITQPEPCSESYLAASRVKIADMGITYKRIDWK